jgi:tetratricopeptide (TPR) repeat protein
MRSAVVVLVLACIGGPAATAQTPPEDADLQRWTNAVLAHQPGMLMTSTREIGEWPWERLKPVVERLRSRGTAAGLLKGAGMYLDIAVNAPLDQRPVYPTKGRGVFSRDGRPLGLHELDSQIWWGRALVAMALDRPGSGERERELAVIWYRAVTAFLARRLNFADLHPHIEESVKRIPDHPGIQFDAGCAAETRASPIIQATIQSGLPQIATSDGSRSGRIPAGSGMAKLLAEAEQRYRAALRMAPDGHETRVRLGRVLALTGRTGESVSELEAAAVKASDPVVEYYNWLFLGDVLTDLRRYDEAEQALQRASALFDAAGSPELGLSRIHSERGDLRAARAAVEHLVELRPNTAIAGDPRWHYDRCAGRDTARAYDLYVARFRQLRP